MNRIDPLQGFYVHTAIVRTVTGTDGLGKTTSIDSQPFPCFINDQAKLVRDAQGQHTIGATTLTCSTKYASLFHTDSEILQVQDDGSLQYRGRITLINTSDSGSLRLPDHTTLTIV